jgi:hypothetical protein
MRFKCKARIVKEYARRKADVMWPECCPSGGWIPNPEASKYPEVCGGDVTVTVTAVAGMYFGDVELEIEEVCTRCKYPFYQGKKAVQAASSHELSLNDFVNEI